MRLILSILVLLTNIKCNKKDSIDDMKTDISNDKQKKRDRFFIICSKYR